MHNIYIYIYTYIYIYHGIYPYRYLTYSIVFTGIVGRIPSAIHGFAGCEWYRYVMTQLCFIHRNFPSFYISEQTSLIQIMNSIAYGL